ncbi:MAG: hypothetical protein ACE5I1_27180 [bacterium]
MRLHRTKGLVWGVILAFAVCNSACSPTPQEELARADKQLQQLQNSNAKFYLQDELDALRLTLKEVESQLRIENLKEAKREMKTATKMLAEAKKMYNSRLKKIKEESNTLVLYITFYLDSANTLIQNMPRKTYVDQNRCDIARFQMQKMKKKVHKIQELISTENYLRALEKSPQIYRSLNELLQLVEIRPVSKEYFKATANKPTPQVVSQSHASIARTN